ncbi:MAG: FHA domain-containing protein [Prevotellaceae bacterium]|nr:FHA domain-containing protein [Prevotellaceae bacterium]
MKRLSCPRCGHYLTFNEADYPADRVLVFVCPVCQKQFRVKLGVKAEQQEVSLGKLVVLENSFHERQELPLTMGDNVVGRYVKGTAANRPIMTSDPSIDTTHCIVNVKRSKKGVLQFVLRDAPSLTGTFYQGDILRDQDRIFLENEAVINIGGTTMIFNIIDNNEQ